MINGLVNILPSFFIETTWYKDTSDRSKYSKNLAKFTYPGGSHKRPYHFNSLERKINGQIKELISNMCLVLLYTVQLVIPGVCTKFQNFRSSIS